MLMDHGAKVDDAENFYHMTALHAAAEENHKPVVELLLTRGANVEAEERNGYTPLTQAGWREYWDTAQVLMAAGAACQRAELVGDWLYGECSKRK
jgi:ankyrin repeat protein